MNILKYNIPKIVLLGVFVFSIFILLYTASISYRKNLSLSESEKLVIHTHRVQTQLELLVSHIREAESAQRGYILTHDSSFLRNYHNNFEKITNTYLILKMLVQENKVQSRNLAKLNRLIDERVIYLNRNLRTRLDELHDSSIYTKQLLKGKEIMDSIIALKERMASLELRQLDRRENQYRREINVPPRWILLSSIFSLLVFIAAFYKIFSDLRHLQTANNNLLISKEIFEHSEQIAEISSWVWRIEEDIYSFSSNLYQMLGYQQYEFEPNFNEFLKIVHPDDRATLRESHEKLGRELYTAPAIAYFRVYKKNKALRYFKSIQKVIVDNYQKHLLITIIADITDQYLKDKILEEKLFDLERSNNELSAFNHVASHDLQEPLRKVQTYISRIRDLDYENLPEKTRDYFERIRVAANRMQKLIDDLLLFSRTNKADKIFEPTDLNEVLEVAKQELLPVIEEKNALIESDELPLLNAIPFQVQQLFINIIGNSLKYSKPGVPPHIRITISKVSLADLPGQTPLAGPRYYKISFADNSIGFEQQYAENIFTLFHRLHDDRSYSGTGIGLTICKKIVENHKGFIKAYGTPGQGATFDVYLPL